MGRGSREFMDRERQVTQKKEGQGRSKIERKKGIENITDGDYIASFLCLEVIEVQEGK